MDSRGAREAAGLKAPKDPLRRLRRKVCGRDEQEHSWRAAKSEFTPRGSAWLDSNQVCALDIWYEIVEKPTEATGRGGSGVSHSGTSSAVTAERSENPGDHFQRLQQESVEAEFNRLSCVYTPLKQQ